MALSQSINWFIWHTWSIMADLFSQSLIVSFSPGEYSVLYCCIGGESMQQHLGVLVSPLEKKMHCWQWHTDVKTLDASEIDGARSNCIWRYFLELCVSIEIYLLKISARILNEKIYCLLGWLCCTLNQDGCVSSVFTFSWPFFFAKPKRQYMETAFWSIA